MDAIKCIQSRRSIRRYKQTPVPEQLIRDIMDAATCAPSSGNLQDWEFVVVRSQTVKKQLVEACYGQAMIEAAPVSVVVCSDMKRVGQYGDRGRELYSVQNTAAAIENLMLAAWNFGVGSCWIGKFDETKVSNAVMLPSNVRPLAVITLGYPDETPQKPKRWKLDEVVHWERFE